jgi:asparagine synthase (glutamine-hydrolysing)
LGFLIRHRGPDDEGYVFLNTVTGEARIAGGRDTPSAVFESRFPCTPTQTIEEIASPSCNLALVNRRLAILDLSPAGHLPISTDDGSLWLTYNGEIYNFIEIREELERSGCRFRSCGDTEVILHAYRTWGPDCFKKFNGMWALALWDAKAKKLILSRDRLGVKPLYYWHTTNVFAFSSEIRCLLELGAPREVNEALVHDFLNTGLLDHTDETFFSRIKKLPAGHTLAIDPNGQAILQRMWNIEVSGELASSQEDSKYAEPFRQLFTDAVRLRLRSDVPVGSCLSGGLDSSSIVTVANMLLFPQEKIGAQQQQKTFSACFDDPRYDERAYIQEVLRQTHATSHYVFPQPEGFKQELDYLLWHQEEPFRSSSIYAQWCVMRQARGRGVIVMLDGQGGDEQLCGYRKFYVFYLRELLRHRHFLRFGLETLKFLGSPETLHTLNVRRGLHYSAIGQRLQNISTLLRADFAKRFAARHWALCYGEDMAGRIKTDITQFSLPALLRYEDKNSMAHSIEARLPFLDFRLVELLAGFPLEQKIYHGWTKYVLRQGLRGILPERIRQRKSKLGFATPEDTWFRQTLHAQIQETFARAEFLPNYVDCTALLERYKRYLSGRSIDTSEFFFRFFILEHWGQRVLSQLFLNRPLSTPGVSADRSLSIR